MIANSSFATGWLVQVGQHLAIWQTGFEQFIRSRVGPSMPGPYYNILR